MLHSTKNLWLYAINDSALRRCSEFRFDSLLPSLTHFEYGFPRYSVFSRDGILRENGLKYYFIRFLLAI